MKPFNSLSCIWIGDYKTNQMDNGNKTGLFMDNGNNQKNDVLCGKFKF